MNQEDLKLICKAIKSGKCLAFLGSGACIAFTNHNKEVVAGLPTGTKLAEDLAGLCELTNGATNDLSEISEYYLYTCNGDRLELENAIKKFLPQDVSPRPIHTVLAQLTDIRVVITSNYDTLLEQECAKYNRTLSKHVYNPLNPKTGHFQGTIFFGDKAARDVIIHKMHGSIDEQGSMVITQSDYIRYLASLNDIDRGMPEYFRKTIIPQFTLLFLGYSLEDWNFKVIWEGVLSRGRQQISYALVREPSDFQKSFWSMQKIKILDEDLTEFAKKLAAEFNLEIPQLGIKTKQTKKK